MSDTNDDNRGDLNVALTQERSKVRDLEAAVADLLREKESRDDAEKTELEKATTKAERLQAKLDQAIAANKRTSREAVARVALSKLPLQDGADEVALKLLDLDGVEDDKVADAAKALIEANPFLAKPQDNADSDIPAIRLGGGASNADGSEKQPAEGDVFAHSMAAILKANGI